jgi:RNA polymerase sigma-70 factor (ECF subfamily)
VQDALVAAWKDMRALRQPDAWDAWLHRLTLRACYKLAQKERRRGLVELQVLPAPEPIRVHDHAASIVEQDQIEQELQRLPIDQRAVMVLHFYLDLPLSEAAVILDIPIGTAKSRLSRGLEALRESLRDEPERAAAPARERTA